MPAVATEQQELQEKPPKHFSRAQSHPSRACRHPLVGPHTPPVRGKHLQHPLTKSSRQSCPGHTTGTATSSFLSLGSLCHFFADRSWMALGSLSSLFIFCLLSCRRRRSCAGWKEEGQQPTARACATQLLQKPQQFTEFTPSLESRFKPHLLFHSTHQTLEVSPRFTATPAGAKTGEWPPTAGCH